MTVSVKAWVEERRAIHANRHVKRSAWSEATRDWAAEFPRALDALEQVLELHGPVETGVSDQYWKEPDYCPTCSEYWPCETAQAIEGAINHD